MITDRQIQHELLKTALQATDSYLRVEKLALAAGVANNDMIHDFSHHISTAYDALSALGVLDQHKDYMENHVNTMMKLSKHDDETLSDLPFTSVPKAAVGEVEEEVKVWEKPSPVKKHEKLSSSAKAKAKARAKAAGRPYPNMVDNIWAARQESVLSFGQYITEEKKSFETISEQEIDEIVNSIEWEDIVDLYNYDELVYEENLQEKLSAQARLKKRQAFARFRGKRNTAKNIKLARASSMEVLKKRAKLAARRAVYKRFLRGRDKQSLSAAEKDRIEQQVARMKFVQSAIETKMLPRMRSIEQKRLAGKHSTAKLTKPSKAPKLKK